MHRATHSIRYCVRTHRRTLEAHRVLCEPAGRLVVAHHSHRRCIRCQRLQRTSAQRHSPAAAAVCYLSGAVRVQYSRCVVQHDATCCICRATARCNRQHSAQHRDTRAATCTSAQSQSTDGRLRSETRLHLCHEHVANCTCKQWAAYRIIMCTLGLDVFHAAACNTTRRRMLHVLRACRLPSRGRTPYRRATPARPPAARVALWFGVRMASLTVTRRSVQCSERSCRRPTEDRAPRR